MSTTEDCVVATAVMIRVAQAHLERVHAATRSLQCAADATRQCISDSLAILAAVDVRPRIEVATAPNEQAEVMAVASRH
jgi:hypothetical protein